MTAVQAARAPYNLARVDGPMVAKSHCPDCAEKDAYIAEMEKALEGAVWPRSDDTARLSIGLQVSPQRAELIAILYRASPRAVSVVDLDQALSGHRKSERTLKVIHSVIHQLRRKFGADFIQTFGVSYHEIAFGYVLGAAGHARVKALLT